MSKIKEFTPGGWVRILKNGYFQGVEYKEGEFWRICKDQDGLSKGFHNIIRKDNESRVSSKNDSMYGIECEWIGMKPPQEPIERTENYQIY